MNKLKELLEKVKNSIKAHPRITVAATVLTLAAVVGGIWLLQSLKTDVVQRIDTATNTEPEKPLTVPSQLTGIEVEPELAARPVIGVMIENSTEARPQSSLSEAGIVFEAVTEGGITRFLALYQDTTPKKMGPIRSVRLHYVDWFMGFDASIAHVGGSAEALQLIRKRGGKDIDQFRYSGPYYRAGDRYAPHNMYANYKDLLKLSKDLGYKKSTFKIIPRKDDAPAETPTATTISADFSGPLFAIRYNYDKPTNSYKRFMAGAPHIERETGKQLTSKNVVVIKMPTRTVGRYALMDTIGSGEALVFKDGTVTKATWKQSNYKERISLIDASGTEIPLNRGQTWFAVVPNGQPVTYKAQ